MLQGGFVGIGGRVVVVVVVVVTTGVVVATMGYSRTQKTDFDVSGSESARPTHYPPAMTRPSPEYQS